MINNLSTRYLAFADPDMRVRIYCDSDYLDEYLHICEVCEGMAEWPEGLFVEFNAKVLSDVKRIFETCGCKLNSICIRDQLSVTCTEDYRRVFTSKLEVMADGQVYLLFNYDGNPLIHELNLTPIIIILWVINLFISLCPGSNLLKLPLIKVPPYYFYVPGSSSALDQVLMRNGILTDIGMYSGKSLSELEKEHPGITMDTAENIFPQIEATAKTEPVEITEEAFWKALECMPPEDRVTKRDAESFKMMEYFIYSVTYIYAALQYGDCKRYFEFRDVATMTHDEIIKKIQNRFKK